MRTLQPGPTSTASIDTNRTPEHDLTTLDEHRPPLYQRSAVRNEAISAVEPRCPSQIGGSRSRNACHAPLRLGGSTKINHDSAVATPGVSCHCATWTWSSHCKASGR